MVEVYVISANVYVTELPEERPKQLKSGGDSFREQEISQEECGKDLI